MIPAGAGIAGAIGLSTSAGLNACLPLLVVALAARYTSLIQLNEPWSVLTSGRVIAVLVVLLAVEMTVDKIPVFDTLNDILQTVGRPVAGAILFAAGSGIVGELHPALSLLAGLLIAGSVHTAKAVARPIVTATTAGTGNWILSSLEDGVALVIAVLSILVPLLVLLLIVAAGVFLAVRIRSRTAT